MEEGISHNVMEEKMVKNNKILNKNVIEAKISEASKEKPKEKDDKKEQQSIKEEKKQIVLVKPKKNEAVVNGRNLNISTKEAVAISNFIRNKNIEIALLQLDEVIKYKRAIPMKGEIPHRKGKIMSGRYPIKAVEEFVKLLKSLRANALVNEIELEKFKIFCMANQSPRPFKRFGQGRIKRSHVVIKLIPRGEK